jgi:hypothetical protein
MYQPVEQWDRIRPKLILQVDLKKYLETAGAKKALHHHSTPLV